MDLAEHRGLGILLVTVKEFGKQLVGPLILLKFLLEELGLQIDQRIPGRGLRLRIRVGRRRREQLADLLNTVANRTDLWMRLAVALQELLFLMLEVEELLLEACSGGAAGIRWILTGKQSQDHTTAAF